MTKILPTVFLYFAFISIGLCANKVNQSSMFPTYGIMQYFVPDPIVNSFTNKPLLYSNNDFLPGKIITNGNEIITPKGMRYNISEDIIECQINTQYSRISSPQKLSQVEIDGKLFEYKKYRMKGDSISGYLHKIYTGGKSLYVKYYVKKINSLFSQNSVKSTFFIEENGNLPKKVSSLRSEIITIYKDKANFANAFMKENNYSWQDARALLLLLDYLENINLDNVALR